MISNIQNSSNKIKGSSLLLPAYGREGQGQHLLFRRRFSRSEIRKIAAAKKRGRGGNSFSPHPFFFPPRPSERVFVPAARSAAIKIRSLNFHQKKFGFCPKGTANFQFWSFEKVLPRPRFARARHLR